MWMGHPDNQSTEAWRDLLYTTEQLLEIAERYDVNLGIETEYSNVINTPERAVEYIKEMQSDRMKIVMDCANPAWRSQRKSVMSSSTVLIC